MKTGYLAERSKQLQLAALSIAQGMQAGSFRSHFRGRGIEFDALREYEAGDDIRSIDWNLMARSGKTFVKLYREERDMRLFLIADVSASMEAGSAVYSPQEKLLEAAALITFAAEHLHSYTGLLAFDGKVVRMFQLRRGREPSLHILNALERIAVSGSKNNGTALTSALEAAAKSLRQRTLVIILSDFKVENFEKELGLLARRHDVAAIRITAPYDEALPASGILRFTDPETGLERLLPTNSHRFRQDRIRRAAEDTQQWENTCIRCGAYPLVLPYDGNTVKLLNQFFLTGKYGFQSFSRYRLPADMML
ncbi:DUF58 domain-containing protein [Treponema vincentii]|uniref:DUF58 domain-containing protein n=1 Tax=Treponema vincentii TaxID=69710 RepID=UPI0020A59938|nr:DUF58 domain-containing protein [Treponema vincentii]UTC60716.1 DUF58 domain-containing protein [Treponema vincentii]